MSLQELEPTDKSTNGTVTLTIEVSDPVVDLGIETRLLEFDGAGSLVSAELAEHLAHEYGVDVTEHGMEVVE